MDNVPHCKMIEDIAGVTELTLEEVKELKAQVSSVTE